MDRVTWRAGGSAAFVAAPAASAGAAVPAPAKPRRWRGRPNILLIVNDQERALADIPASLPLPAHDWLRERGLSFDRFHVNTTPCGPSRSSLYTGLHTQHTCVYANPNSTPYPKPRPPLPNTPTQPRHA